MSDHRDWLDLAASYALGALEPEDRRRFEEHLESGCAECEDELALATADIEALASTVAAVEPSEMTRARLLKRVAGADGRGAAAWLPRVAVAAGLALLVWSGAMQIGLRRELQRVAAAGAETRSELAVVRTELAAAQGDLRRVRFANRIVASPGRRAVQLAGLESAPGASAQSYVDRERGEAVFFASDLPAPAESETYQLWYIADGTPVSGGVFDVDEVGTAMVLVEGIDRAADVQLWAVTVEPAGGVPQPTGAMVLKG